MPREAARLFLEVKSVRVERLQDITEADAKAEGVKDLCDICRGCYGGYSCIEYIPIYLFEKLWDNINAKRGYLWDSNPWVFVYEFMRVEAANEKYSD